MITECDTCKKTINRQASWLRGKKHFCNKECHIKYQSTLKGEQTNNWQGGSRKFHCKLCGKPCERKKSVSTEHCSSKCAGQTTSRKGNKHWNWKGGKDTRYMRKLAPRPKPELCEVCEQKGKGRNGIVYDHDHKTGKFRGWLCSNCNTALGLAKENTQTLRALIRYLNQ